MSYNKNEDLDDVDRGGYLIGLIIVAIFSGLTGCFIGIAIGNLLF